MTIQCTFKEEKNHWSWKYNLYFRLNVIELVLSRLQSDSCLHLWSLCHWISHQKKMLLVRKLPVSDGKQKVLWLSQNVLLLLLGTSAQALLVWGEALWLCETRIVLGLPPSWRQGMRKLSLLSSISELVHDEIQVLLHYKEGRCSIKL